jgi:hypothetical protein
VAGTKTRSLLSSSCDEEPKLTSRADTTTEGDSDIFSRKDRVRYARGGLALVATRYLQAHSVRIKFDARCMFRGLHKDRIGWLFRGGACPEVRAFSTDQHELGWRSVSACLLERASISVCLYICIIQAGLNSLIANRSNLLYSSGKQLLPYHLPLIILRTDESSFYLPPRYAR